MKYGILGDIHANLVAMETVLDACRPYDVVWCLGDVVGYGAVPDACAAANLDRPDLLRRILDDDASRVHDRGGDGQTPLHFARSREVVDLLLDRGADPDARDRDHRATPAQWMLDRRRGEGRYELAEYLVRRGATADIFLAAALGLADRLRTLLHSDPPLLGARTGQGEYGERPPSSLHIYTWSIGQNLSPLQVAAQFGQDDALDVLRTFAGPKERFLAACASARAKEAKRILEERPELFDSLNPDEQRALPDAAWAGMIDFVRVARRQQQSDRSVAPHAWGGGAAVLQNVHAAFAVPNTMIVELPPAAGPLHTELWGDALELVDGRVRRPDQPGLGVRLTDELKQRFPFRPGMEEFSSVPGKLMRS
jgi:hypothetical protein